MPGETEGAIATLLQGERLGWEVLKPLDASLKAADPRTYGALAGEVRRAHAAVGRVISRLAPANNQADLMVVVCSEAECGDASGAMNPQADGGSARYFATLTCLLQRAVDLLARLDGKHAVWLHVLSRPVIDPLLGQRVQFHIRHLGDVARRVQLPPDGKVRLVTAEVPFFQGAVNSSLVLADFVANRCRPALARPRRPLPRAEKRIQDAVGGSVRSGAPPLSHLAATGKAEACIQSARCKIPPDLNALSSPGLKLWACEQAREWVEYLLGRP
jgi:hypothetical protein